MSARITITRADDGNSSVEGPFDAPSDLLYCLHHLTLVIASQFATSPEEVVALLSRGLASTVIEENDSPEQGIAATVVKGLDIPPRGRPH